MSSRYMVPLALELARDSAVYAPDLPGFGRSSKPPKVLDMVELADALAAWTGASTMRIFARVAGMTRNAMLVARHATTALLLAHQPPQANADSRV